MWNRVAMLVLCAGITGCTGVPSGDPDNPYDLPRVELAPAPPDLSLLQSKYMTGSRNRSLCGFAWDGRWVIAPHFHRVLPFRNGYAWVLPWEDHEEGRWRLIDGTGATVLEGDYRDPEFVDLLDGVRVTCGQQSPVFRGAERLFMDSERHARPDDWLCRRGDMRVLITADGREWPRAYTDPDLEVTIARAPAGWAVFSYAELDGARVYAEVLPLAAWKSLIVRDGEQWRLLDAAGQPVDDAVSADPWDVAHRFLLDCQPEVEHAVRTVGRNGGPTFPAEPAERRLGQMLDAVRVLRLATLKHNIGNPVMHTTVEAFLRGFGEGDPSPGATLCARVIYRTFLGDPQAQDEALAFVPDTHRDTVRTFIDLQRRRQANIDRIAPAMATADPAARVDAVFLALARIPAIRASREDVEWRDELAIATGQELIGSIGFERAVEFLMRIPLADERGRARFGEALDAAPRAQWDLTLEHRDTWEAAHQKLHRKYPHGQERLDYVGPVVAVDPRDARPIIGCWERGGERKLLVGNTVWTGDYVGMVKRRMAAEAQARAAQELRTVALDPDSTPEQRTAALIAAGSAGAITPVRRGDADDLGLYEALARWRNDTSNDHLALQFLAAVWGREDHQQHPTYVAYRKFGGKIDTAQLNTYGGNESWGGGGWGNSGSGGGGSRIKIGKTNFETFSERRNDLSQYDNNVLRSSAGYRRARSYWENR